MPKIIALQLEIKLCKIWDPLGEIRGKFIYSLCVKGWWKLRDAEIVEDVQYQGRRKLPKGGAAALLDQSGDAGKGSDIETRKDGNSAWSAENKKIAFIFSYQDGLSWRFRTSKTRKRRFQIAVIDL